VTVGIALGIGLFPIKMPGKAILLGSFVLCSILVFFTMRYVEPRRKFFEEEFRSSKQKRP
jgi:hypothetical protein